MEREERNWRKASYSNGQGDCVEVADAARAVLVRDTKDRDGATLAFSADAWHRFLAEQRLEAGATQHLPGHPRPAGAAVIGGFPGAESWNQCSGCSAGAQVVATVSRRRPHVRVRPGDAPGQQAGSDRPLGHHTGSAPP